MKAKHTKGPWFAHPFTLQVVDKKMWFDEDGSRHGDTPNMVINCDSQADTHLIAAAPEMLAALEAWFECEYGYGIGPTYDEVKAVIAKAKGE